MGEGVLTSAFARTDAGLACEGVPLAAIAGAAGTPTYVYSARAIREQYQRLLEALQGVPLRVHYSMKANGNLAIAAILR